MNQTVVFIEDGKVERHFEIQHDNKQHGQPATHPLPASQSAQQQKSSPPAQANHHCSHSKHSC